MFVFEFMNQFNKFTLRLSNLILKTFKPKLGNSLIQ